MVSDSERELRGLDRGRVQELASKSLGQPASRVAHCECRPAYTGLGVAVATSAVYRISGTAIVQGNLLPWSVIAKVLYRPKTATDAVARPVAGWDREVLTYRSGLLDELPDGLAAPRCFGIEERQDNIWLWLEDVADEGITRWTTARFAQAAWHLGRFNGQYLDGRPLPEFSWLSRTVLRQRAERNTPFWTGVEPESDVTLLKRLFPGNLKGRARRIWEERYQLLDVIDRLPQTLVHGDADRRNLFGRRTPSGQQQTVAIDWAWTGVAAVGEELVNLVAASAIWNQTPAEPLADLAEPCLENYVAGLTDAGWRGDRKLARIGFAAGAALRYGPLGPFTIMLRHPGLLESIGRTTGLSSEEQFDRAASVQRFAFDQLDALREDMVLI